MSTIGDTLTFLQENYHQFQTLDETQKSICLKHNEEIQKSVSETSHAVPLRTLYIDLAMHDEMVSHSIKAQDKNRERINLLLRNKIAIQRMIAQREGANESVTPDSEVEHVAKACVKLGSEELKKALIDQWVPKPHRATFLRKLKISTTRKTENKHNDDHWSQNYIKHLIQQCILSKMRSVEEFRAMVAMVECIIRYRTLTENLKNLPETQRHDDMT